MSRPLSESDILGLIDARVAALMADRLEVLSGTVYGVPDTSRNVLVLIGDDSRPVPVHRGALPMLPVAGERVAVLRGPEGLLQLTDILDRDPTAPLLPGGDDEDEDGDPTAHTLGLHLGLGLVDQDALIGHADDPSHLRTYTTPNAKDTDEGKWAQMASGSILDKFGSVTIDALVTGGGSMTTARTHGLLHIAIVQAADFGTDPAVSIELVGALGLTGADVAVVVTDNAEPSELELHVRVTREYEWLAIKPLHTHHQRAQWAWTGCTAFASGLPTGTAYTGSELPAISPAQLISATSDWNPAGLAMARVIRLSTDASRNLSGIVAQGDGRRLLLRNIGAQNLVIKHDVTSTAANRFLCPGAADFTLNGGDSVWVAYDATSARWFVEAW